MKNVLVTGANGFIGRHFVPALLRSKELTVTCSVRQMSNCDALKSTGCELVYSDIRDVDSLDRMVQQVQPDCVFHLAGLTKATRPQSLFDVNQHGTANLIMALSRLPTPPIFVLVSTLAAAGPSGSTPRKETESTDPRSNYGKSKLAAEQEAAKFADRLPITIVRPPVVFGPHDRDTFEMFLSINSWRFHPVPRDISISWIQVEDVCRALIAVGERGERISGEPGSGVYFATAPEIVNYAELGRSIATVLRRSVWTPNVPGVAVWGLAAVNEFFAKLRGKPNIFNFDKAREATAGSWTCDGQKLERDTGFSCERDLNSTLVESAEWYKSQGWL